MVFKCKMCGGELVMEQGMHIGVCQSCGTRQTVSRIGDEERAQMYDRADYYRRNGDYDRAMREFEKIIATGAEDCELYWALLLCKYGILYVTDPATGRKMPTCNRMQRTSIKADPDYLKALAMADAYQKTIYQSEAGAISDIQQRYMLIVAKEKPYDVFISYKESDDSNQRTPDSVLAHRIYDALTARGLRVFYSRISLSQSIGKDYEAIIYAALTSARVMLLVTTSAKNAQAVWVKNEWSRFLNLLREDDKKMLIPVYQHMDPYDLPDEITNLRLQAQDMEKIDALQNLTMSVLALMPAAAAAAKPKSVVPPKEDIVKARAFLRKGYEMLAQRNYSLAGDYFDRALREVDEREARAYIGRMLAKCSVACKDERGILSMSEPAADNGDYQTALRYAANDYRTKLLALGDQQMAKLYAAADEYARQTRDERDYRRAAERFERLKNYGDSPKRAGEMLRKASACLYENARSYANIKRWAEARDIYNKILDYEDSREQAKTMEANIQAEIDAKQREADKLARKKKRFVLYGVGLIAAGIALTRVPFGALMLIGYFVYSALGGIVCGFLNNYGMGIERIAHLSIPISAIASMTMQYVYMSNSPLGFIEGAFLGAVMGIVCMLVIFISSRIYCSVKGYESCDFF